ncbi:NLR family member X1 isoform X2 [Pristis pectinata]|uniref:NLR family member X1 isoform X2 n=1 Tax=Pristis pectinata TaxID=685728 RepID=UPI00223D110B|nr:NLR family member X1 isoform X2 [Pristis pectinata]XP_051895886.1 NLR family member X1 isoform X2 [Pristis pectinata]
MQHLKHLPSGVKWTLIKHRMGSTVMNTFTSACRTTSGGFQHGPVPNLKQIVIAIARNINLSNSGRPGSVQHRQCVLHQCKALSTSSARDPIEEHRKRLKAWFGYMPSEEKQFGLFSVENWHVEPVIAESSPEENRELTARFGIYSHIDPKESKIIKFNKVFTTGSVASPVKNVVLFGIVGMGKETVVKRLVLDWCDGQFNQFDLILPFSCEDLSSQNQSISLNKLISQKYTQLKSIVPQIGSGKLGNILFIFNGLEQLKLDFRLLKNRLCNDPNEPLPPNNLLVNLLRKYMLPEASILVTMRPSALHSIPTKYVDKYTRSCGFSDVEQQYLYFRNRLEVSEDNKTNEDLMRMLYRNLQRQSQLTAGCFLPSYCWLICAMLHFLHFATADMPVQTLTGLYTNFLRLNFGGEILDSSNQQSISIVRYIAKTVGKLAYEGIEKKKVLFSEEDLQRSFGLDAMTEEELNQVTAFQIDMLGFFMSPIAQHSCEPLLRFTIPAMQEYLAALYVVLGEKKTILEQVGGTVSETIGKASEDVTAVLSIVSKLLPFRILTFVRLINIFPRIFRKISWKSKKAIANTMIFEMFREEDEFNNDVLEQINASILGEREGGGERMDAQCFELFPVFMAGLLAQENRCLLNQLGCTIKNVTVREIANSLKKHLSSTVNKQLAPSELMDLLLFLHELQNDAFAGEISGTLNSLDLSQVKMTLLKCIVIASVMNTSNHPIEMMNFSLCNLMGDHIKILHPVLQRCKNLNLQFNNLGLGAWREISNLLQDPNCAIENLRLCGNTLSEAAINCIGPSIIQNSSVSHLSLLHTSLGDDGLRILTPYIRDNTNLKEINLANNLITDDGVMALVEMVKEHPTLEKVHLYLNEISNSGKQKLQALKQDPEGVNVLVSITEGSNDSVHWTLILKNIVRNAVNQDKQNAEDYLQLLQNDLKFSWQQTRNPWKKMKLLQVQNQFEYLQKQIQQQKK